MHIIGTQLLITENYDEAGQSAYQAVFAQGSADSANRWNRPVSVRFRSALWRCSQRGRASDQQRRWVTPELRPLRDDTRELCFSVSSKAILRSRLFNQEKQSGHERCIYRNVAIDSYLHDQDGARV